MPRKTTTETESNSPAPRVEVLERRLQNPFGEPSAPVTLKDAARVCRWFNADKGADAIWRAKQKGWDQVTPEEVFDLEQIGGYTVDASGFIVRGERGKEVLMSMPKEWRERIEYQKAKINSRDMGNPSAIRRDVIEAAGAQLGDEAGEFMNKHTKVSVTTQDKRERIAYNLED